MNHPDIIYVHHEKPDVITVDEIRSQVVSTVGIRPYESEYKIYIIDEAEKMNPQAQNALLKTIEEPPVYAVIMLLSSNPDSICRRICSFPITKLRSSGLLPRAISEGPGTLRPAPLFGKYRPGSWRS